MMRDLVARMAASPVLFDALRWTLEGGYHGHRNVVGQELARDVGAVLDCGCGTGIFAGYFPAEAYTGVDLCPAYVAAAQRRHPGHRFLAQDARQLDFADHSFDGAFLSGVLHHLDDGQCRQALGELARVVKPQGKLVVWEDVPTRRRLNLVGKAVHRLDLGSHIRQAEGYQRLIEEAFRLVRSYPMRSGFMDYQVFCCRNG